MTEMPADPGLNLEFVDEALNLVRDAEAKGEPLVPGSLGEVRTILREEFAPCRRLARRRLSPITLSGGGRDRSSWTDLGEGEPVILLHGIPTGCKARKAAVLLGHIQWL